MQLIEAIKLRHSVRQYVNKPIEDEKIQDIRKLIDECNQEGQLNFKLMVNEPKAFTSRMAKYGKFKNVSNYIVLAGKKDKTLDERCGYYGEKIVLRAQQLGLNTCFVGLTYKKMNDLYGLSKDDKIIMVLTIGYGETQGISHKVKDIKDLCEINGDMPKWFENAMRAVQLAPTALNQQKFKFILKDNIVTVLPGRGFYTKADMGIAKYHFEIGAGDHRFTWK